ncbi:HNH endonuclease [Cupidesulfovibrio liaohensis]|uniref:HNH endonuclease n=1 Tax=Nitratidesulfovibrio liaohensis TaxID=2604158 RepID=UPI0014227AD0|nr:HNH endonuclease [Nitratidesulfovibrio liaohensis]
MTDVSLLRENYQALIKYHDDNYIPLFVDTAICSGVIKRCSSVCRYCKKSAPDVSFKNTAHTIPMSLGNINLVSGDECDECNHYFGNTLENCLGNFTIVERAIFGIKGRKRLPTRGFKFKVQHPVLGYWRLLKKLHRVS